MKNDIKLHCLNQTFKIKRIFLLLKFVYRLFKFVHEILHMIYFSVKAFGCI